MKLFCFPYAGGSSAVFNRWKSYLNSDIELMAIELAGRGRRISEPLYNNFNECIEDVLSIIKNEISSEDYMFFGHSMGAKISYDLTQLIIKKGLNPPRHVFLSGRGVPNIFSEIDKKKYYLLPDDEFKEEILNLGGTPKEFFDHPELLEVFLPLLKNDFKLAERDEIASEIIPLPCDITVFIGADEELTSEQVEGWKNHTTKSCSIHYFEGGHFFINEKLEEVLRNINKTFQTSFQTIF